MDMIPIMPDDLYERDILIWSEHQADLLRRIARGACVNDVDWAHVVEEIESVGLTQLHDVETYLRRMLVALLKCHGWPGSPAIAQWREESVSCQADAGQRFTPSMRQKIDLQRLHRIATEQVAVAGYDGREPCPWPATCPFTLDQLLNDRRPALEAVLAAASAP